MRFAAVSPQTAAPSPLAVGSGKMMEALAKVTEALAKMLAPLAFAAFGIYFMQSNLAAGLGALRTSDVLVTAALGGVGWAFTRYLEFVNKRFDTMDAALREVKQLLQERAR